jgi:hypothetical protein
MKISFIASEKEPCISILQKSFQTLFIKLKKRKSSTYSQQQNAKFKKPCKSNLIMIEKKEATFDQLREAHKYLSSPEGDLEVKCSSTEALRKQLQKTTSKRILIPLKSHNEKQNLITINHSQEGNQKTQLMQISQVGEAKISKQLVNYLKPIFKVNLQSIK